MQKSFILLPWLLAAASHAQETAGNPPDMFARVMLEELKGHLEGETVLEEVIICVLDTPQYTDFESQLAKLG